MIGSPPLREQFGSLGWQSWFTQVFSALMGWKKTYTVTLSHDFGSISAQSEDDQSVTVTGARVGDAVTVHPAAVVAGVMFDGSVSANNTVSVRAVNYSAAPVDPPDQTYRIIVFQQ